jgi:hypothetical protein
MPPFGVDRADAAALAARWGTVSSSRRQPGTYRAIVPFPLNRGDIDFEHRDELVLVPLDSAAPETVQGLQRILKATSASDDTTVVVAVGPTDDAATELLEQIADDLGDAIPDIVVVAAEPSEYEPLAAAATQVYCVGANAPVLASLARQHNTPWDRI